MKTHLIIILVFSLLLSCSGDTVTNEFYDANNPENTDDNNNNNTANPPQVLITKIAITSVQYPEDNAIIYVSYDANNRVSSVSNGESALTLVYYDGKLKNIAGPGETFNVEELYGTPYNAFEIGEVLNYDNNHNPILLLFPEEIYDPYTDTYDTEFYTAEIYYDTTKPNPYFYTLQAAGVIAVLDDVQLNFSSNAQSPDLLEARLLFPYNNIKRIVYKDGDNVVRFEVLVDYVYNEDDHPISATVTGTSPSDNETQVYTINYTYKE